MSQKHIPEPPDGSKIIALIEHQGTLVLATERRVYRLVDDLWKPIPFAVANET